MLDCSGGTSVLTEATVAESRISDSYLKVAHSTRTRATCLIYSSKEGCTVTICSKRRIL